MKLALAIAVATFAVCAGCGDSRPGDGTAATAEQETTGDAVETSSADESATASPGASSAPSGGPPPPPALAPVYSAKITKVDKSSTDKSRYDIEVIFTSGQGRTFKAIVATDGGTLVAEETIPDVPDAYYAHVFSFNHTGTVKDLNVQIIAPDEKSILDKWDL
jgi:hypothetical protein